MMCQPFRYDICVMCHAPVPGLTLPSIHSEAASCWSAHYYGFSLHLSGFWAQAREPFWFMFSGLRYIQFAARAWQTVIGQLSTNTLLVTGL